MTTCTLEHVCLVSNVSLVRVFLVQYRRTFIVTQFVVYSQLGAEIFHPLKAVRNAKERNWELYLP
jgi:hypothetical protein